MSQTKAQLIDPVDGTIVNADINASAAIDGTKVSPDFGSQNIVTTGSLSTGQHVTLTGENPRITFADSNHNPDFEVYGSGGKWNVYDSTNGINRLIVNSDGHVDIAGNLDVGAGIDVTGDLSVTGEVQIADSIVHTGDGDTAIRFHAADSFSVETGGAQRLSVSNSGTTLTTTTDASFFINSSASGGAHIRLQNSGTTKSFFGQAEGIAGALGGANDFALRSAGNINFAPNDTNTIKVKIDTSGRLLIGTTTEGNTGADDLTIQAPSGSPGGITIRSDTDQGSYIYFSDGTSGDSEYRGFIQYIHSSDYFNIGTASGDRFVIGSLGQLGIGGQTYGNAGEALVSQGASAAPQWASPKDVTIGSLIDLTTVNGGSNQNYVMTGIPNTAYHIRLVYADLSSQSSSGGTTDLPILRVGNSGGIKTSGYRGWTVYNYWGQTSSYSPVVTTETTHCPLWARQWHTGAYHMNGFVDLHRVYCDSNNVNSQWVMSGQNRIDSNSDGNGDWWATTNDGIQRNTEWFFNSAFNFTGGETLDRLELNANISGTSATFDTGVIKLYYWS